MPTRKKSGTFTARAKPWTRAQLEGAVADVHAHYVKNPSVPQPRAEQPLYIAVVDMPRGPYLIENEQFSGVPRVYFSEAEAREALKNHQLVRAFGGELFQIGTGIKL